MAGSEFFDDAYSSGMSDSESAHVTLPEVTSAIFEAILNFLYLGEAAVARALTMNRVLIHMT